MHRLLVCVPLAGCVWIGSEARFDQDQDRIPAALDCNDESPSLGAFEAWEGTLGCGDAVTEDLDAAPDLVKYANCAHPLQPDDLVWLGGNEHVWRLRIDEPTDVRVDLETSALLLPIDDRDTGGIAMVAFQGPVCALDACTVALPESPPAYREQVALASRPPWAPVLYLRAEAGEAWYLVVSGGRKEGGPSPYTLAVSCGS